MIQIKTCSMHYAPEVVGSSLEDPEGLPSMLTVIVTVDGLSEEESKYITSGVLKVLQEVSSGKLIAVGMR